MRKNQVLLRAPSSSSPWSMLSYNTMAKPSLQHLAFGRQRHFVGRIQKPVLRHLKSSTQENGLARKELTKPSEIK